MLAGSGRLLSVFSRPRIILDGLAGQWPSEDDQTNALLILSARVLPYVHGGPPDHQLHK